MSETATTTGPYESSSTVRFCDVGNHRLARDSTWYLVQATGRGWENNAGVACPEHASPNR